MGKKSNKKRQDKGRKTQVAQGLNIPVQDSLYQLPNPILLRASDFNPVDAIIQSFLVANNIAPGTYNQWASIQSFGFPLHDQLIEALESELLKYDCASLVIELHAYLVNSQS